MQSSRVRKSMTLYSAVIVFLNAHTKFHDNLIKLTLHTIKYQGRWRIFHLCSQLVELVYIA